VVVVLDILGTDQLRDAADPSPLMLAQQLAWELEALREGRGRLAVGGLCRLMDPDRPPQRVFSNGTLQVTREASSPLACELILTGWTHKCAACELIVTGWDTQVRCLSAHTDRLGHTSVLRRRSVCIRSVST